MDSYDLFRLQRLSLKELRLGRGRTHQEVADKIGMHRPNVVRLERVNALWSTRVETLMRVLEALDYDLRILAVPHESDGKRSAKIIELVDAHEAEEPRTPKRRARRR